MSFLKTFLFIVLLIGINGDMPIEKPKKPSEDSPYEEPEPPTLYGEDIPVKEETIVYVLDTSGSMRMGTDPFIDSEGNLVTRATRIKRAKEELKKSILSLSEDFKFNIVAFDCNSRLWRSELQVANTPNKQQALAWIDSLRAVGGTGIGPAVVVALEMRPDTVVLLSDGYPSCGAGDHAKLIHEHNKKPSTIHTFGISVSGIARDFMQKVASENGGNYYEVN